MVYAFIIHTLFPGQCKVLFNQVYCSDRNNDATEPDEDTTGGIKIRQDRKNQIQYVASQVRPHTGNMNFDLILWTATMRYISFVDYNARYSVLVLCIFY